MDGDGDSDLVANRRNLQDIFEFVLFEKLTGDVFADPIVINAEDYDTEEMIAADYDGDGDMDIASAGGSSMEENLIIYRNDGANNFTALEITNKVDNPLGVFFADLDNDCLLYTSPSPRDKRQSRMPSSA